MGLLKSASNEPGIDYVDYRDQTYYNKYEYRVRVRVEGLRRAYYHDPDEFEDRLKNNKLFGRLNKTEITMLLNNLPAIKHVLQFKKDNRKRKDITIRMEYDVMAVFHNDLQYLHSLFDNIPQITTDYTRVETTGYSGIKTFAKEPKHKFRVYFRSKRTPDGFRAQLSDFFKTNKELRPSPALKHWMTQSGNRGWWWDHYISSGYFIDYNDESYLTYFHLLYGEFLGKKYKLEKRPDKV